MPHHQPSGYSKDQNLNNGIHGMLYQHTDELNHYNGMPNDVEIHEYDESCPPLISVRAASQCISAVVFQDISMYSNSDDTWVFLNPNARNIVPGYIVDQFRYHAQSMVDDFKYDSY